MVFEPRERRVRNRGWRGGWLHGAYWLESSQILETTSAKLARSNFSIKRTKTEQRSFRMILNLELLEGADPVACTVQNFDIDSFFVEKYIRVRSTLFTFMNSFQIFACGAASSFKAQIKGISAFAGDINSNNRAGARPFPSNTSLDVCQIPPMSSLTPPCDRT